MLLYQHDRLFKRCSMLHSCVCALKRRNIADWSKPGNYEGIAPRCDLIGVAPTCPPWHSREAANGIGAFFFFFGGADGDSRCQLPDDAAFAMSGVCSERETAGCATRAFRGMGIGIRRQPGRWRVRRRNERLYNACAMRTVVLCWARSRPDVTGAMMLWAVVLVTREHRRLLLARPTSPGVPHCHRPCS